MLTCTVAKHLCSAQKTKALKLNKLALHPDLKVLLETGKLRVCDVQNFYTAGAFSLVGRSQQHVLVVMVLSGDDSGCRANVLPSDTY